jgi:hypothetical protein
MTTGLVIGIGAGLIVSGVAAPGDPVPDTVGPVVGCFDGDAGNHPTHQAVAQRRGAVAHGAIAGPDRRPLWTESMSGEDRVRHDVDELPR